MTPATLTFIQMALQGATVGLQAATPAVLLIQGLILQLSTLQKEDRDPNADEWKMLNDQIVAQLVRLQAQTTAA